MNAKKMQTLPAESNKPCDCCKRVHRKLYHYNGFWMGSTCLNDYENYLNRPDLNFWKMFQGGEKTHAKVTAMVQGR